MSAIDTAALDEAVRRFQWVLRSFKLRSGARLHDQMFRAIQREYRLVLAERSKGRGV